MKEGGKDIHASHISKKQIICSVHDKVTQQEVRRGDMKRDGLAVYFKNKLQVKRTKYLAEKSYSDSFYDLLCFHQNI